VSDRYNGIFNAGAWLVIALAILLYFQVVWVRYANLHNGIDLGTYTQIAYNLSSGHQFPPYNSLLGKIAWADHAHFILILIAPLYAVVQSPLTLLGIQLIAITTSAWVLFSIAQDTFKNWFYSYVILISTLLFFGVQYALDFDFHANVLTAALLAWMFWAYHFKKWKTYWIFFVLVLITREDASLFCAMFAIYMLLFGGKEVRKVGVLSVGIAVVYFLLVVYVLIPRWEPTQITLSYFDIDAPSRSPSSIAWAVVGDPLTMMQNILENPTKMHTLRSLVGSFGFLPLASAFTYLVAAPNILARFLSAESLRWEMGLHYSASVVSILSYGAILGTGTFVWIAKRFLPVVEKVVVPIATVLLLLGTYMVSVHNPDLPIRKLFSNSGREVSSESQEASDIIWNLSKEIPEEDSVVAVSSFVPAFSNREHISYFPNMPQEEQPDWIILSSKFLTWPLSRKEMNEAIGKLSNDAEYVKKIEQAGVVVYIKK
jgi:uncharacterized membrane protein